MTTLFELEAQFGKAKTTDQLKSILQSYLQTREINTFSFTYYNRFPNSANPIHFDTCSENFVTWHQHYLEAHYEDIDSTLAECHQQVLPMHWDLRQQLAEAQSPQERQMRQDSLAFGAEKGISIPIHGPLEDFATFLVVQMQGESCLEVIDVLRYDLWVVGKLFYEAVRELLIQQSGPNKAHGLSRREVQCLKLLSDQSSVENIAKALGISTRTVNFHIQKLNKKLGVNNKYLAVIKAKTYGLIS